MKIAYLEDDDVLAEHIGETLHSNGHECELFRDGSQLIRRLKREHFDLLLLDWSLPGVSGHQVTIWARANLPERVPILFMTSRSLESDIVTALSAGADDYMIKPIRNGELLARIDALSRRAYPDATAAETTIEVGRYRIDPIRRACFLQETPIELTGREFDLVLLLFQHVGRVLSREHIGGTLWGQSQNAISRTLDTHMSRVRSKLQLRPDNGVRLTPVYGHGYRLEVIPDLPGEPPQHAALHA
ncbi:response regulator transcription factor [Trinickia acidisoli]|uniref:response regulator transcription factor n=1 Tax=Trinickia acidisoli TaxID=2767482 RepID=UPI001A8F1BD8|nr:response regulator transcription factor [Trinickia acidisoli]